RAQCSRRRSLGTASTGQRDRIGPRRQRGSETWRRRPSDPHHRRHFLPASRAISLLTKYVATLSTALEKFPEIFLRSPKIFLPIGFVHGIRGEVGSEP